MNPETKKFYKPTFDRIKPEKREHILRTAAQEFAASGYSATSINTVADKCGISIGSMYSYFKSKEDLFMTIVEYSREVMIDALNQVAAEPGDLYAKLTKLVHIIQTLTPQYRELNQIYIDLATEGLTHLSSRLSMEMESYTAEVYHTIMEQARQEGVIADDVDEGVAILCIDNIITLTQFAYSSNYYRERMKIYAGEEIFETPERLAQGIIRFIHRGLSGRQPETSP